MTRRVVTGAGRLGWGTFRDVAAWRGVGRAGDVWGRFGVSTACAWSVYLRSRTGIDAGSWGLGGVSC